MDLPKKIGRYEILEELGHGAMGTVYLAKDPAMNRVVALKTIISMVLASEQGADFRERFYREARTAGALAHPGIVSVFDVGEHEGSPFLVMEFISGQTLANAVKKGERLTPDRICEIGQKIAEALGYAHQHGVIHRDIKPANILLTSLESHGIERPKITDFGVAKLVAGHTTMTGQILGTPAFMPPEQFTGAPIDGRADIFSLGVVLYWMATGEQPFPGESMTAVSYKVVHTDPPPPQKLNPSIPARLEGIIMKCLAKSPDDRYQTCEELARDLAAARVRGPVTASQSVTPAPVAQFDPDATLKPGAPDQPASVQATQPSATVAAPRNKSNSPLIWVAAAVAVIVIGVGGRYALHKSNAPAPVASSPAPAATSVATVSGTPAAVPAPGPAVTSSPSKPPRVTQPVPATVAGNAPIAAAAKPAGEAPPKKAAAAEAAPDVTPPASLLGALDFDPKALNPKENAKLKIEADQLPPSLDFTVEMNGKTYLQGRAEGDKTEFDNMYVPPGIQEFRVVAKSGSLRKVSNTVSMDFKAKKKNTMKIELRGQGLPEGSGVPGGLYPNTQLVVTLK